MDVKTLCLGLLSIDEACGYDLKKEFESVFKHFYPAGYGSIYPALADLADKGLVSCRQIPQTGKPDRKSYRITDEGRQAFDKALRSSNPTHRIRSEFLATLYFSHLLDSDQLNALLDGQLNELQEEIKHIDEITEQWDENTPTGARFVSGFGAALTQAAVDYIKTHRDMLVTQKSETTKTAVKNRKANDSSTPIGIENRV